MIIPSICSNEFKELSLLLDDYLICFKYSPEYLVSEFFKDACYGRWKIGVTQEGNLRFHTATDLCESELVLKPLLDAKKGWLVGSKTLLQTPNHDYITPLKYQHEVNLNDTLSFEAKELLSKLTCDATDSHSVFNLSRLAVRIAIYSPLIIFVVNTFSQCLQGKQVELVQQKKMAIVAAATIISHLALEWMWHG